MHTPRRGFLAALLCALSPAVSAQRRDNSWRIAQLVKRIENEYTPRGRKEPAAIEARAIANPARVPATFFIISSLDRTTDPSGSPGTVFFLNFNAVDEYLAGRGSADLDSFDYLCSFVFERQYHETVALEFRRTPSTAAKIALLATLRWTSYSASSSRLLAEALNDAAVGVRRTALISLAQRTRLDRQQSEYDIPAVLGALGRMNRVFGLISEDVALALTLLGEAPFAGLPQSSEIAKEILRTLPATAPRDQAINCYASRL